MRHLAPHERRLLDAARDRELVELVDGRVGHLVYYPTGNARADRDLIGGHREPSPRACDEAIGLLTGSPDR